MAGGGIIGVDMGGTLTDLVMLDADRHSLRIAKTPTTPEHQTYGVLAALDAAAVDLGSIDLIVHGMATTIVTRERKVTPTGGAIRMAFLSLGLEPRDFVLFASGGGGYGDPAERDPALIEDDKQPGRT